MEKVARPLERDARAAIYRRAARAVELGHEGYACNAIFAQTNPGDAATIAARDYHPMVEAFHRVYRPDHTSRCAPYFAFDDNARVIALCFMAAMVEAGDA